MNTNNKLKNTAAISRYIENKFSWIKLADKLFKSLNL